MKFGAHVSISGGYIGAIEKVHEIGGNALQIFSTSPRGWNFAKVDTDVVEEFKKTKKQLNVDPVYFHASYLINLANTEKGGELSRSSLIHELKLASMMDVRGSIVHLGSFKNNPDLNVVASAINEILSKTPPNTLFMIENAGNKKIGKDLTEIAALIKLINNKRVRVCLDTCHMYSAGYDISTHKNLEEFLKRFDHAIGLDRLEVIHVNDSRDPYDSGRDRHENIGQGTLTLEPFRLLLNDPKTNHLPFIIETPGFDDNGPDKKNLDILKKLVV